MVVYSGQTPDTLDKPGAWMAQGACVEEDPEMFFAAAYEAEAKSMCARCPVLNECHVWIMQAEHNRAEDYRDGIVAGLTPTQRAALDTTLQRRLARTRRGKAAKQAERKSAPVPTPAPQEPAANVAPEPVPTAVPTPEQPPTPEPVAEPAPAAAPAPQSVPECGTDSAHRRHIKRGEPIDPRCRAAHTRAERERRYAGDERKVYAQWAKAKTDEQIAAATGLPVLRVRRTRKRLGLIENQTT
ncbi:WhiB family transcriptional regulator [Streptomyces sp. NPDC087659]|uniref:WhiB family transcriptional regulator n=1 Tax=Streptomyces sp. NPDC087659 TaxID=3365801 RepID=UPI003828FFC1